MFERGPDGRFHFALGWFTLARGREAQPTEEEMDSMREQKLSFAESCRRQIAMQRFAPFSWERQRILEGQTLWQIEQRRWREGNTLLQRGFRAIGGFIRGTR